MRVSFRLVRGMLLCPTSVNNRTKSPNQSRHSHLQPVAVSIVTSLCRQPINLIRLVNLPEVRLRHFLSAQGSNNVSIKSPSSLKSFAVCVRPMFNSLITVDDVIEFIEVNRVFGADLFFFYIHDSVDRKVRDCLRNYERIGYVETTPWELPFSIYAKVSNDMGQILTTTECAYRLMYRTKYLAEIDLDEFIVPMRTEGWQSMLTLIDAESGIDPHRIASYSFRNRFFLPTSPVIDSLKPNDDLLKQLGQNWNRFRTLTHISAEDRLFPWRERSKILARPERILIWHVHEILDRHLVPSGEKNLMIGENDGVLQHFRRQLKPTGTVRNETRLWNFTSRIVTGLKHGISLCSQQRR
jgi:hypothetical protein